MDSHACAVIANRLAGSIDGYQIRASLSRDLRNGTRASLAAQTDACVTRLAGA
jgi:hypothetical protein